MCDSLVALPIYTQRSNLILAKNSDREPDEAQALVHIKRQQHHEQMVQCTYIAIPQAKQTFEVILSKPFQMWGAEMGVNEKGVAIANEAVFTNVKIDKSNNGLTGMDLLRLALERSACAKDALNCIVDLLQKHSQDACGGYRNKSFFYHNSFLIADADECFQLETAGKSYAWKKVNEFTSISNGLSLELDYDEVHIESENRVFPLGKVKNDNVNFRKTFSDLLYTTLGRPKARKTCTFIGLQQLQAKVNIQNTIQLLQQHHLPDGEFTPNKATTGDICMHATGLFNPSETTCSMVAEIRKDKPSTIWLTGTNMPCLSVYIPFFMGTYVIEKIRQPGASADTSLWWRAGKLHRWVCEDYLNRKTEIQAKLKIMQEHFISEEQKLIETNASLPELEVFSLKCLEEVESFYNHKSPFI
jgi:dipeptidase